MSFWKRTLGIFRDSGALKIELRGGKRIVGELETIGDNSCSVRKADGSTALIEFEAILSVEPGVARP
jgi:hypothetical protein